MACLAVQFQKILSMVDVNRLHGGEEQCHAAFVQMRWPDGFECLKCGGKRHIHFAPKRLFQCTACRVQTSAWAETILYKSRTPLCKWFLAMHVMTASKNDIAALELASQLDVKWNTAWLIKRKLMKVMRQRNSIYKLAGDMQIDDVYRGGKKPGKRERGAQNKTPFVSAVQTRDGRLIYSQRRAVIAFTKEAIKNYAARSIAAGSRVLSDGFACFDGIAEAGLEHIVKIACGGRLNDPNFNWVNTGLSNVKSAITGTLRSCDPQHAPGYLVAFEWCYNRRFDLKGNLRRRARVATTIAPQIRKANIVIGPMTADISR